MASYILNFTPALTLRGERNALIILEFFARNAIELLDF